MAQRVLLVEDNLDLVSLLKLAFARADFDLAVALNGNEALQKTRELQPDLVLMDLMLPDMDGIEVCRRLRAHPDLIGVRVVMLSACCGIQARRAAREVGVLDYWTKPFSPSELLTKIQCVLKPNDQTSATA